MRKKTVLLVEDDADVRNALQVLLKRQGHRVTCAANGQEALDLLRAGHRPSLIVLDLVMPVMDGWRFRAEQLKDPELARVPVIVVSADAHAEEHAAGIGAVGYLKKPVRVDRLVAVVGE
jgi:CheY-like chemotaxis protein